MPQHWNVEQKCCKTHTNSQLNKLNNPGGPTRENSQVISLEHDGIVARGDVDALMDAVREAVNPMEVTVKVGPEDPWQALRERFPQYNWDIKSEVPLKEYLNIVQLCRGHIKGGPQQVRANTNTFARYVAMALQSIINVPAAEGEKRTHFEMFSASATWHVKHRDDLSAITSEILRRLVCMPCTFYWEKAALADPPPPLNSACFADSLTNTVMGMLAAKPPMAPLNGERCRGKLLFQNSIVCDFRTN